jgi:cell division initiation protein
VTITPQDIEAQQFPIVFRGYKVEDVDAFLDRLQHDLTELLADRAGSLSAAGSAEEWPRDRTPAPDSGGFPATGAAELTGSEAGPAAARALRTLQRAEQMAEQVIGEAAVEADEIRGRAKVEAETIIAAARAESDRIGAETNQHRQREVGALLVEKQQLRAEVDRLCGLERDYRDALLALLTQQQRLLEQRILDGSAVTTDDLRPAA